MARHEMNPDDIHESRAYGDGLNRVRRGDEVNLTQKDPTLRNAAVAIAWDLRAFEESHPDLDVSVFLLDKNEKTRVDEDFIFYNNHSGCDGAVRHKGDSRTGAGDGDDETILLSLADLPFDVAKIVFTLSIYDLDLTRDQDFSLVRDVYFRIVNQDTGQELLRYELHDELSGTTAVILGQMERVGSNWVFRAIGENVEGGLSAIATNYGIVVAQNIRG